MVAVPRRSGRYLILALSTLTIIYLFNPWYSTTSSSSLHPFPNVQFQQSTFDWTTIKKTYPKSPITSLPKGPPRHLPRVQFDFSKEWKPDHETTHRRDKVRNVFLRTWNAYKEHAWARDELAPVSGAGKTTFGGWSATLVDALDTLWIMDLKNEFYEAANVASKIDWANTTETAANLFETTIRHLGGLLSAYDLSGEKALLKKATELGEMLLMAFDTPNGLPGFWLRFEDAKTGNQLAGEWDPSAAPCSLSLEFTRLAQLTGQNKFYDAVDRVTRFLERSQESTALPGMWPRMIDFREEDATRDHVFSLGALADSLYEYFPKMFALLGGLDDVYAKMYRRSMEQVIKHLLFRPMIPPGGEKILFAGDADVHDGKVETIPDGQHLACFVGGMFGLGGRLFNIIEHIEIGEQLARGCAWAYDAFPTGVMPELFSLVPCDSLEGECKWWEERWELEKSKEQTLPKGFRHARDPRYILRPEAIESVFLLYRITGKADLLDVAWRMFESVVKATETGIAFSAIGDVTVEGETEKLDSMESFWLSETLKYFYLIFSPPDLISLDDYVLNTEAHPFKRPR